ncbi:hypothetical protein SteCoe_25340 [Stentor coeruleus]|uniref:G domain-containing protein n=1 Tax=Stentor coeruleus TaxID=5963 RepID=A0A1R2BFG1_9CILI|nr:hypothetical protein SteCoe_25340 [Stentor coeruleus]
MKSQIHQKFSRFLEENSQLFNSSIGKEITVYIGNTGSGKSTLINYLCNIELTVSNNDNIILKNSSDYHAMKIGCSSSSQTSSPQFVQYGDILHYDFPGFGDTRGETQNLINGCFIKNVIEGAKFSRLIIVISIDEIIAQRGMIFKNLIKTIALLIPNQQIEYFSSLIITKTNPSLSLEEVINFIKKKIDIESFGYWLENGKISKMSQPQRKIINQDDKVSILRMIRSTRAKKINEVNINSMFLVSEVEDIKEVYYEELSDIASEIIKKAKMKYNDPISKKAYFMNKIKSDYQRNIENSALICLLVPIYRNIYNQVLYNHEIKFFLPQIQQTILLCENLIESEKSKQLEKKIKILEEEKCPIKPGRYHIENTYYNEYLFVSGDKKNGDNVVETRSQILGRSEFHLIKNSEGYLFFNPQYNKYIFLSDSDKIKGDRVLEAHSNIFSKSYFEIHKKDQGFVIKNIKHSEYLFVSGDIINGDRVVEGKQRIEKRSFFRFVELVG